MSGPSINFYKDITASKDGGALNGLVSASYSFNRNFNTSYSIGSRSPVAIYGFLPDIDVSYTGYASGIGGFNINEANTESVITISGKNGSVNCANALLSSVSYDFNVNNPFTITKTFRGYSKPAGGGGGGSSAGQPYIIKRQDYSGSLPPGLSGNYLIGVKAEISIQRQNIEQFATRKPYASVITFPISKSITYEVLASSMDSITVDSLITACQNPNSTKYTASISACGISFSIDNAYVTAINYNGGEASSTSSIQTISVTYTSYDDIQGLKPVILFK